jgi:hypothetical protein
LIPQEKIKELIGDLVLANMELRQEIARLKEELDKRPERKLSEVKKQAGGDDGVGL